MFFDAMGAASGDGKPLDTTLVDTMSLLLSVQTWQKSLLQSQEHWLRYANSLPDRAWTRWERLRERERATVLWMLAVGTAVGAVLVRNLYHQRIKRSNGDSNNPSSFKKGKDEDGIFESIRSARSSLVTPEAWQAFEQAAFRIRNASSNALTNGDRLLLYGLYKQVVDGNAPEALPPSRHWNILAEQAKYEAWRSMRDIPMVAAMDHYITAVDQFCSSSSSSSQETPESDGEESSVTMRLFGPAAVSRPVVENGTVAPEEDDASRLELQLLEAAAQSDLDRVRQLLSQSTVAVNYQDGSGQSALHLAADRGSLEIVQALLQAGAHINAVDHDGISVLQAAVIAGHVGTCQLLLQNGADPDQPDQDGDTPRSCAVDDGDPKMMVLFSFEVPVN